MAGKSTYLRSVAVAALLARTLDTCPARQWAAPCPPIRTLMNRRDDPASGRSYYQVEVDTLAGYLEEALKGDPRLFVLDEPLRGTNTPERIAAGVAVLDALLEGSGEGHVVLAATHDPEIGTLLRGEWTDWHFRESVTDEGLHFDHLRRPGPARTRTAISLLEAAGAAPEVVGRARALLDSDGTRDRDFRPGPGFRAPRTGDAPA